VRVQCNGTGSDLSRTPPSRPNGIPAEPLARGPEPVRTAPLPHRGPVALHADALGRAHRRRPQPVDQHGWVTHRPGAPVAAEPAR
jgi:hypothetical protein